MANWCVEIWHLRCFFYSMQVCDNIRIGPWHFWCDLGHSKCWFFLKYFYSIKSVPWFGVAVFFSSWNLIRCLALKLIPLKTKVRGSLVIFSMRIDPFIALSRWCFIIYLDLWVMLRIYWQHNGQTEQTLLLVFWFLLYLVFLVHAFYTTSLYCFSLMKFLGWIEKKHIGRLDLARQVLRSGLPAWHHFSTNISIVNFHCRPIKWDNNHQAHETPK